MHQSWVLIISVRNWRRSGVIGGIYLNGVFTGSKHIIYKREVLCQLLTQVYSLTSFSEIFFPFLDVWHNFTQFHCERFEKIRACTEALTYQSLLHRMFIHEACVSPQVCFGRDDWWLMVPLWPSTTKTFLRAAGLCSEVCFFSVCLLMDERWVSLN